MSERTLSFKVTENDGGYVVIACQEFHMAVQGKSHFQAWENLGRQMAQTLLLNMIYGDPLYSTLVQRQ